jgi:hypothetical protein
LAGCIALALIGGIVALRPSITFLSWAIRTIALLGYLCVFITAGSSIYMRQLVRTFGRPFVQTHHIVAVTGLISLALHPLLVAWSFRSARVFVPVFDSWINFFRWGGRLAWYLIGIAALAGLLRTKRPLRQQWRTIHFLNYLAFILATTHAILLGSEFRSIAMKVVAGAMAAALVAAFVLKRLQRGRRRAKRR